MKGLVSRQVEYELLQRSHEAHGVAIAGLKDTLNLELTKVRKTIDDNREAAAKGLQSLKD